MLQKPLPVLTHPSIYFDFGDSALSDGFLGGSAPSLQQLDLCYVLYPALPTLLLSASNLVNLRLRSLPPDCDLTYASPKGMVSLVAASPKLEILNIDFTALCPPPDLVLQYPLPDLSHKSPLTRTILPSLRAFSLSGECKYLEDFFLRIDAPQLNSILVDYQIGYNYYFDHRFDINFTAHQLSKFLDRSEILKQSLSRHRHCEIMLLEKYDDDIVTFCVGHATIEQWNLKPGISIRLEGLEGHMLHMINILGQIFPILSDVVHCTFDSENIIYESVMSMHQFDWLQLLCPLSSLQTLFVSNRVSHHITLALTYLEGGMITKFLPALKLLCLEKGGEGEEKLTWTSVHKFLEVRRECGHPVTFVNTKEEFEDILKSNQ
jgi:hypothetical protein